MTNISFELEGQHRIIQTLNELYRAMGNVQEPAEKVGDWLENEIQLGIKEGHSPWGDPFEPLQALRRSNRDPRVSDVPLNDTRQHIYNRITHQADGNGVMVGMLEDVLIGATHQFGSERNNIPARPFLPITSSGVDLPHDWENEIMAILQDYLDRAME